VDGGTLGRRAVSRAGDARPGPADAMARPGASVGRSTAVSESRPAPRIGIMGGTFDPIHLGHLAVAASTRASLALTRVLFLPAGIPPHKPDAVVASVEDRVAMVRLAIAGRPAYELSRVDVDRPGPSYTADSVRLIAAAERAEGRDDELVLILSAETFAGLPEWHEPARLLADCRIAVVPRGGHDAPDPARIGEAFPGQADRIVILEGPRIAISSTEVRARVAAGRSVRDLVPSAVARYIADHGLYQTRSIRRTTSQ
jgi:nicotinate-nucleotide adenylyltransferase